MPQTPAPDRRSTAVLLGVLLAALLLLRNPESLLHPQFWAEDGTVFFQDAFNSGFFKTLLRPVSGYLVAFARLVAGLSLLFPMEQAPLVFNLAAFFVQLAPALYLASPRMSRFLPSFAARVIAAVLYISLPASHETHVNLTNSQWYLALTAVCILVARQPASVRVQRLETAFVALFSLSGPFSVLLLPFVAPRIFRTIRGAAPDRDLTLALGIAVGALVQIGFALTSARVGAASPQWGRLTLPEVMTVVSMHTFFTSVFGVDGLSRFHRSLPPIAYALGLLANALLLFVALRDRVRPLLILFHLAVLSIALSFAFPLNDPRIWLEPGAGPRYFLFARAFILFTLLHLALRTSRGRLAGALGLGVACAVGIPADFFHPGQPDVRWADQAAVFRTLPAGSDFYVPVVPLYHGGMVLHKTSPRRETTPLARLRPIASATAYAAAIGRPRTLVLTRVPNDSLLRVDGWAVDQAARRPAGGVYVRIDDKLFPAVYGLPATISVEGRAYEACGFSRVIPIAEIGPGPHEMSIIVITGDGTGYYEPAETQPFSVSQFFP